MKTGKTLTQLAQALEEQKRDSKDFIVPTELLTAAVDRDNKVSLRFNEQEFSPNTWSHSQLSSFGNTPKAYYDRFSYEESIELERAGGSIIELSKSQWSTISEAA